MKTQFLVGSYGKPLVDSRGNVLALQRHASLTTSKEPVQTPWHRNDWLARRGVTGRKTATACVLAGSLPSPLTSDVELAVRRLYCTLQGLCTKAPGEGAYLFKQQPLRRLTMLGFLDFPPSEYFSLAEANRRLVGWMQELIILAGSSIDVGILGKISSFHSMVILALSPLALTEFAEAYLALGFSSPSQESSVFTAFNESIFSFADVILFQRRWKLSCGSHSSVLKGIARCRAGTCRCATAPPITSRRFETSSKGVCLARRPSRLAIRVFLCITRSTESR